MLESQHIETTTASEAAYTSGHRKSIIINDMQLVCTAAAMHVKIKDAVSDVLTEKQLTTHS